MSCLSLILGTKASNVSCKRPQIARQAACKERISQRSLIQASATLDFLTDEVQERNSCLLLPFSSWVVAETFNTSVFLLCWKTGHHDEINIQLVKRL
ncbi:hypothetical protein J6590_074909 [Homalodisca vitripennis]|nr:hypothetical protein J6590_074909 [Homalodisca vitripennis]